MDEYERRERAANARAILESDTMKEAFEEVERRCIQDLKECQIGDLTATSAHARMKALEDIKVVLMSYINDPKFIRGNR